jgi:hypothetical protein
VNLYLTTVYENVDAEWLEWYLDRLESSGYPEQIRIAKSLRNAEECSFSSNDPTNPNLKATTTYRIEP